MSEVLFFFYFDNREDAEKFSGLFKGRGFIIKSLEFRDKPVDKWSLRMTKEMNSDELMAIDEELINEAKKHNGEYDGYER